MTRLGAGLRRLRWRALALSALALVIAYPVALLLFFGKIGWSLLVLFGLAPLLALALLASQIAHIVLRGRS